MKLNEMENLVKNTEKGVTIIFLPEQKKWGVQFKDKEATFHQTFTGVMNALTKSPITLIKK